MVRWHHPLDGREFEQALGVGDGQGNLVCCSPWGCKESELDNTFTFTFVYVCIFFSIMVYHRIMNIVLCAIQDDLAAYLFVI